MEIEQPIQTIRERIRTEIRVKGSRFIATAVPVATKEEALSAVAALRKEFWDATHNCYAYQLGPKGADYRFFDDGEPSGSAGKPILLALQRRDILNVVLVVTRYFGGTKLGVGGLARAYAESADAALDAAEIVTIWPVTSLRVFTPYDDMKEVRRLVESYAESFEEEFKDVVIYTISMRDMNVDAFADALTQKTSGRAGYINLDRVPIE